MNHNDFFAKLKNGSIDSCYLFQGSEEYIKQQALKRLQEKLLPVGLEDLNLSLLQNPDADTLVAACETFPMMTDKRLVVVRDSSLLSAGKKAQNETAADKVSEYLSQLPPTVCVVFYVKDKADGRKKIYTQLKKMGCIVDFSPMNETECANWIERSLKQKHVSITKGNADLLVFTVGKDASLLTQEMEKLVSFVGENGEITEDAIKQICIPSVECNVFQMVDAQVGGKTQRCLQLLNEILRNGEERMMVLSMLLRQYRILYHMRCLMEEKTSPSQMASLLGIPPFSVSRTQQQARMFSRDRLKQAYDYLMDYEYRIKQGFASQDGCTENAVFQLNSILRG